MIRKERVTTVARQSAGAISSGNYRREIGLPGFGFRKFASGQAAFFVRRGNSAS
jgi:hypothetical protein